LLFQNKAGISYSKNDSKRSSINLADSVLSKKEAGFRPKQVNLDDEEEKEENSGSFRSDDLKQRSSISNTIEVKILPYTDVNSP
jgi:hypothetical protein